MMGKIFQKDQLNEFCVGADTHETMRQFHPQLQDHCLFLPYAGSRRVGDLVLMNFWNEGNDDTDTRYLIQPVLPYPYDEIMTWSGTQLYRKLTNVADLALNSTYASKSQLSRYCQMIKNGTTRLRGIFNQSILGGSSAENVHARRMSGGSTNTLFLVQR